MYKHTLLRGGSESDDINDIDLSQIDHLINIININTIKGGFPRIKICDNEITKKILEKKPREFSNNKIMSIKDMLKMKKKTESSFNLLSNSNIISGFHSNNEIMNIIKDTNDEINGISIDLITGKNKQSFDKLEKIKSKRSKSKRSKKSKVSKN
jgi:hypothetical protein